MKKLLLTLSLLSALSLSASAQVTVQRLGFLNNAVFLSQADKTSADGSVVVGFSRSNGEEAFRWTTGGGMVGLGDTKTIPPFQSWARDVSHDGSVIVGAGTIGSFRWTATDGIVALADLPGGTLAGSAFAVSGDGTVIGGYSSSTNGEEAYRWTQATGTVGLGDLAGGGFGSRIYGASRDGSVLVGYGTSASGTEAMYWTEATGMVGVGDLTGGLFNSQARAVSRDGSVLTGYGTIAGNGTQAFRWTQATGMVAVPFMTGGTFSDAWDISGDGNLVVGYGGSTAGTRPFVWRNGLGTINLEDYLVGAGVSLGGFIRLDRAHGISDDGTTIVGYGTSASGREAFRVYDPNRFGLGAAVGASAPEPASFLLMLLGPSALLHRATTRMKKKVS